MKALYLVSAFSPVGRRLLVAVALLTVALAPAARAQCNCTQTIASNPGYASVITVSSGTVCINAGVTLQNATIHVTGNNVTICNSGTLDGNYSNNGFGSVDVDAGLTGVVINNLGTVRNQTFRLRSAVTLNNGSSNSGQTVVAAATWQDNLSNPQLTAAPVINNYASWQAQLQNMPGGTITNYSGATWNGYITLTAALSVTNAGNWQSQIQEGSSTLTIVHNAGSWTGGLGDGSGSLRITANANWTKNFNFSGGSNNAFTTAANTSTAFSSNIGTGGQVTIINNGTMTFGSGLGNLGTGSSMTNAAGSTLTVTGGLTSNGTLTNNGTMNVSGNFMIGGGTFMNNGSTSTGQFTNSAVVANRGAIVVGNGGNFTNSGTITGTAALPRATIRAAAGTTNSGNFGADGSYLDFCDSTPPNPASNGFDSRAGTIGPNVAFCAPVAPLPVELTRFSAQAGKGKVELQWATAQELNSAAFVVERSATGEGFAAVAKIKAQGNSTQATVYAALDAKPLAGLSYYRLRQVDLDGTTTYSQVLTVSVAAANQPLGFYPNPATDRLTLDLRAAPAAPCEVHLTSLTGKALLTTTLAGGQAQELPLAGVPAGLYLLHVRTATGSTVQRMEKK